MKIKSLIVSILLGGSALAQTPTYVPSNGLVGYWGFNGNANDQSGNSNNGTVNGATLTTGHDGTSNSAYKFNGINQWISVLNSNSLNPTSQNTISLWCQSTFNSNTNVGIVGKWNNGTNAPQYVMQITSNGMNYNLYTNQQKTATETTNNTKDGIWHNYIGTWDGQMMKLYRDGLLITSIAQTGSVTTNSQGLEFGRYAGGSGIGVNQNYYNGNIDDIGIWNRALTQQEITALFKSCTNPIATITPQSSTTFCEGNSVTLNASTGLGYTYEWYNNNSLINNASGNSYSANISGNYTVKVIDGACNTTSSNSNVIVNPNPIASISASGPTTFCNGGSVTLTASGGGTYLWNNNSISSSINVTNGGTYSTTVTLNGCSSTASQTITVNPNPIVSLASLNTLINNNSNAITLVGTPIGGTYVGSGVSGASFNPHLAGLGTKTITYNYTNLNNCSGSASRTTIVYDTTGIVCTAYDTTFITVTDTLIINVHFVGLNNTIGTTVIKIYPNPTSDVVYVNTGDFTHLAGSTIKIINALGQSVFTSLINQQLFTINTTQFGARGVYTVQIIDSNQVVKETRKIVLQ